jgi:hypothetical protein
MTLNHSPTIIETKHTRYNAKRVRNYERENFKRGVSSQFSPFIGVDGEGGGVDAEGRQNYLLLQAGDRTLFKENRRLATTECLDFILSLPRNAILCGYFFGYDSTQILRDLPLERIKRIMIPPQSTGEGKSPYTFWGPYAIDYRPRQYLRVAYVDRNTLKVIPNTSRTINEVGGFFQQSFVQAITNWKIGSPDQLAMIARMKDKRAEFVTITPEVMRYCAAECKLLAELMTALREVCIQNDIVPKEWRGAGWISARLHEKYKTPKRGNLMRTASLDHAAINAYYGGRFEITACGLIPGPVYVYDINSAYPSAMLKLPCPFHTSWRPYRNTDLKSLAPIAVVKTSFNHSAGAPLCNLPIRRKGHLFWPRQGSGTYWSPELAAAARAGSTLKFHGGYFAVTNCTCASHSWVAELYEKRRKLGKATIGYPIKLGLNGLYGKYAQRMGAAPWRDYTTAGLITAIARAKLIDAYVPDPGAVIYLATDALFSRRPLALDIGPGIGQWEEQLRPTGLFMVQPGVYWSPGTEFAPKTRGIPRATVIEHRAEFEAAWNANASDDAPAPVKIPFPVFIGHRQALAWGRPEAAGSCWATAGA